MSLRGRKQAITAGGAIFAVALLAACSSNSTTSAPPATGGGTTSPAAGATTGGTSASGTINAAGSTFQANFQSAAISAFKQLSPSITVNYNAVGSGTGRTDLYGNTVLIAGSDSPVPAKEKAKLNGRAVLYFPVQVGPISL